MNTIHQIEAFIKLHSSNCNRLIKLHTSIHQIDGAMVLQAGRGAKGSVLTRLIRPKQTHFGEDENHRSKIVIVDRFTNKKGTVYFRFRYLEDQHGDGPPPLHCAARLIRITEEGRPDDFFVGDAPEQKDNSEPNKWETCLARQLLYNDIKNGLVDEDATPEEVYVMHPEYALYNYDKFGARLKSLVKIVKELSQRAKADQEAYDNFVDRHLVSKNSAKGYIQWKGSASRTQALEDIKGGLHLDKGWRGLWKHRDVYQAEFPFEAFRDKCKQEVKTSKYLHTLKKMGKKIRLEVT